VKEITENPDMLKLGGEKRILTVMFLDLENFTTLSESLPPEKVVEIINTYFDALTTVIMDHGGTVDKFEGDAIMALYGAPVNVEDHALRACKSALALRAKIEEINQKTGQKLNLRIGIATGEAIVGNMGSKTRFDYTAMGDTVNTASRLEGGNKFYGTRILVNAEAFGASQSVLAMRRIDRVRLKGKENPLDIYEVMGMAAELNDEGKLLINEWHQALEYYRNQQWDEVEKRMNAFLLKAPGDGPTQAYLARIKLLRQNPPEGWDAVWKFDSK